MYFTLTKKLINSCISKMKFNFVLCLILSFLSQMSFSAPQQHATDRKRRIEIIIPSKGSSVKCRRVRAGKTAILMVKGNSINLKQGEYITLLLKPKGEGHWLRISNSNRVERDYAGLWEFNVEMKVGKKCKTAEMLAIVSGNIIKEERLDNQSISLDDRILCRSKEGFFICTE